LEVSPSLTWNVELKLYGPLGPTLGFVMAEPNDTYFKLYEGMYRIFPVIRKYNPYRNEIISYYPKWSEGTLAGQLRSITVSIGPTEPTRTINIEELLGEVALSTGCAFLLVENQGTSAVSLYKGNDLQMTSTGVNYVQSGSIQMFQINMTVLPNNEYAQSVNINSYKIGSNINNAGAIGNVEVEVDKIYRVVVTGNDAGFTVSAPVFEAVIDF
jgi:hypothetical protein